MPADSDNFADLDARDNQNKPLRTAESAQAIGNLFRENLLNLTVFANPHAAIETMNEVECVLHLINKSILIHMPATFELLMEAIMPPTRRFVHNVDNLWTTFSVGIFAGCLLLSAISIQRSPRQLNLRC